MIDWPLVLGLGGYALLEYWLGKTNLVKPGSALEVLISIAKQSASVFIRKKAEGYTLPPKK